VAYPKSASGIAAGVVFGSVHDRSSNRAVGTLIPMPSKTTPPQLTALAKRLTKDWKRFGVTNIATGYGLDASRGKTPGWGLHVQWQDPKAEAAMRALPKQVDGYPVRLMGPVRALRAGAASAPRRANPPRSAARQVAYPPATPPNQGRTWIPEAWVIASWTPQGLLVAGLPLALVAAVPLTPEGGFERWKLTPSTLARATLAKSLVEEPTAQKAPPGTSVTCKFYWRDGAPGAECSSLSAPQAEKVGHALERFWEVDAASYRGENIAKWKRLARG